MSKRHLKSMAAPKSWPIERKTNYWITRPNPGAHSLDRSMPITLILKLLKYAEITKEVKQLINQRKVLVNGVPVKEIKFPAGLFDVISFTGTEEAYRIVLNKVGKLTLKKINKTEVNIVPQKIVRKTMLKSGKLQLNFENGYNLIIKDNKYNTNDVLVVEKNTVKQHIPFEKGSIVYIVKGKRLGQLGKISEIHKGVELGKQVQVEVDKNKFSIPKTHVFVIGKEKPIISLDEK